MLLVIKLSCEKVKWKLPWISDKISEKLAMGGITKKDLETAMLPIITMHMVSLEKFPSKK